MKQYRIPILAIVLFTASSCMNEKLEVAELKCSETNYGKTIKPFLLTTCAYSSTCHTSGGGANSDFNKYSDVFAQKDEIIRRINLNPLVHQDEFMPRDGAPLSTDQKQMLQDWVNSGATGCD